MVMAETMTMATMVSNHLLLPAIDLWPRLNRLRRHLLPARWIAATLLLLAALAYERLLGGQYELVQIGLISFSAVLVLAPPLLGGLYWREASTAGALWGLAAGFAAWGYTLLLPVFVRAGWLPEGLLTGGPGGIGLLRPEALLGLAGLDRISHAVLWILLLGGGAFVLGSLLYPAQASEAARAQRLLGAAEPEPWEAPEPAGAVAVALAVEKRERMVRLFARYHEEEPAGRLADTCLARVGVAPEGSLSALQLAELEAEAETTLASSIGTAAAHAELRRCPIATGDEERAISAAYGQILASLKVPPAELQRKIDYHRERERLLAHEAETHRFLADVSAQLAASLDVEATGATVVGLAVPRFAEAALLWVAPSPDEPRPRAWLARSAAEAAPAVRPVEPAEPLGAHPGVAQALETGRMLVARGGTSAAWPDELSGLPRAGEITFPLAAGGRRLGALVLFLSEPGQLQSADDLALAEELAGRSAVALVNAALFRSAEEAVRARDEFLAVASHELKTPLTPLRLSIQAVQRLVARGELAGDPARHLHAALGRADGQIRRLVRLVDYLLDVSRITTRRLRLQLEPTDLSAAVVEVLDRHRAELSQAGCTVSLATAQGAVGRWDRLRIEQVVTNLLTNAMKYAPGPIDVAVDAEADRTRLVVRDRGPGIAREDQERIFLPFERAVSYLRASGFGLGLFIVRQIVDAHGGTVHLESAPGQGSTFTVELPRQPPASA
jgi:signal transduction histidine kinase